MPLDAPVIKAKPCDDADMVNLFGMMVVIFVVNMTIVIYIVKLEYDGRNN